MDTRLHILHVTPSYFPAIAFGGPIRSSFGLNRSLSEFPDLVLEVLTTDTCGPRCRDRLPLPDGALTSEYGYPLRYCRKIAGKDVSVEFLRQLPTYGARADVIHLVGVYSFPALPVLAMAAWRKIPVVWSPRGSLQRWRGRRRSEIKAVYNAALKLVSDQSRILFHVTSEAEGVASREMFPSIPYFVVPNGVDVPATVGARIPNRSPLRLIFIGRLHPSKALEHLIDAMALLSDVRLSIFGSGDSMFVASLHDRVRRKGLEFRISFEGALAEEDKATAFAGSDICVLPSYSENFGMVAAEALAHGIPVIASTGTPWFELPTRGCGRWVDNDPVSLAAAIENLAQEDLPKAGSRGRAWMLESYSWNSIARRMLFLYRSAVDRTAWQD